MRYLGVDLGDVRTGLALSDPVGVTCAPLAVIRERDKLCLCEKIIGVAKEHGVGQIVVGLPRSLAGGTNSQAESVLTFVEQLRQTCDIDVVTWDERFTSRMAQAGRSRGKDLDAVAACYMLQNYLDALARTRG
jgi:putative Holliday junction resolvase